MKSQSSPSNHLLVILILIVTAGFASLKFVSCANFTVINQLEHGKPLVVECPPHPGVSIDKGRRNTWHLDNNPPTLACNFTSNGRKTEIDNVLGDKDLYYLALNDGIARGTQDVPNDGKGGDWRMAARWYDEDEFNKDPCKRDPISCESYVLWGGGKRCFTHLEINPIEKVLDKGREFVPSFLPEPMNNLGYFSHCC